MEHCLLTSQPEFERSSAKPFLTDIAKSKVRQRDLNREPCSNFKHTLRLANALQKYGPISGRGCLLDELASLQEARIYIHMFATHLPISMCLKCESGSSHFQPHRLIVYSTSSESSREQSEAGQPGPGPGPARCIVFIPLSPGIILNEISNSELNLLTIRSAGFYDRKLFTLCKYNFANVKTCFNLRLQLLHSGCEPLT